MYGVDEGNIPVEEPWVTELLRDITMDEAYTPVWRLAEGYHPSEESIRIAIGVLSPMEQQLVYVLYRDEVSVEDTYRLLDIAPNKAAKMLSDVLERLRNPCLLRMALKGLAECQRETDSLHEMQAADIFVLGLEVLGIPVYYYDVFVMAGIYTIGEAAAFLVNVEEVTIMEDAVPTDTRAFMKQQLTENKLWDKLLDYLASLDSGWQKELGRTALVSRGKKSCGCDNERLVSICLNQLSGTEREVLTYLYRKHASERLVAGLLHTTEETVAEIHKSALAHLGMAMREAVDDRNNIPSVMGNPFFENTTE